MEKRIELEKRGKKPAEILELNLDNCRTTTIVGLTDDFSNLEILSLINVGLTSLKGFPNLPSLKKLELSDNRISGGLNMLHTSPKLTNLNLSGNKILTMDVLEPLKELEHLTFLDLFNNEVTSIDKYRDTVFTLLPSLKYLDGFDKDYTEVDTDVEDEEVNGNDDDSEEDEDEEGNDEDGFDEEGIDDEGLDDEGIEEEEEDFVPLRAVYNNDLDDGSDADYEGEGGDEEDPDVDSGDDLEENSSIFGSEDESEAENKEKKGKVKEADGGEESPARGKKRKHEGEEVN